MPNLEENYKSVIFKFLTFWLEILIFLQVRHQIGVPYHIMEKQKRPRESTDLEEYDFIVPKNII